MNPCPVMASHVPWKNAGDPLVPYPPGPGNGAALTAITVARRIASCCTRGDIKLQLTISLEGLNACKLLNMPVPAQNCKSLIFLILGFHCKFLCNIINVHRWHLIMVLQVHSKARRRRRLNSIWIISSIALEKKNERFQSLSYLMYLSCNLNHVALPNLHQENDSGNTVWFFCTKIKVADVILSFWFLPSSTTLHQSCSPHNFLKDVFSERI